MNTFQELSLEETCIINGGGFVRNWFGDTIVKVVKWWNSCDEPVKNVCEEFECVTV
jgi:hypothetical protein